MTEPELRERAAAFQTALAAALRAAGVSGVAAYALLPGGPPQPIGEGPNAIQRLPDPVGGDAVFVLAADGRRIAEVDAPTACVLLAQLAGRLDQLKEHYAALFGADFSCNFERLLAEQRAAAVDAPTIPFDRALRDVALAFKPCIVLGATIARELPDGRLGTQGSSGLAGSGRNFDEIVSALGMISFQFAKLVATLSAQHGIPGDEAVTRIAAAAEAVEQEVRKHEGGRNQEKGD